MYCIWFCMFVLVLHAFFALKIFFITHFLHSKFFLTMDPTSEYGLFLELFTCMHAVLVLVVNARKAMVYKAFMNQNEVVQIPNPPYWQNMSGENILAPVFYNSIMTTAKLIPAHQKKKHITAFIVFLSFLYNQIKLDLLYTNFPLTSFVNSRNRYWRQRSDVVHTSWPTFSDKRRQSHQQWENGRWCRWAWQSHWPEVYRQQFVQRCSIFLRGKWSILTAIINNHCGLLC